MAYDPIIEEYRAALKHAETVCGAPFMRTFIRTSHRNGIPVTLERLKRVAELQAKRKEAYGPVDPKKIPNNPRDD